jgi:ferredoxin
VAVSFTVRIDSDRCQGHGKCAVECPDVFDSDDQGFAVLTAPDFPDPLRPSAQKCVDDCPEGALTIVD